MMMMSGKSRSIFTASQWQELDNQTQIFKYMVSGVPIPPDLLFHVKRSLASSRLFHYQQPIGWGCFQVGFGRKLDPEPGRCRRTDGKKWRCSKEAFTDSKYCERHMHRGRNRSRKPVEILTSAEAIPSTNKTTNSSYYSLSPSMAAETHYPHQNTTTLHPFLFPNSLSSRTQHGTGLVLDSSSSSQAQKDHRYFQGLEEVEDNNSSLFMNPFFPDTKKQKSYSELQHGYNQLQLQNPTDHSRDQYKHQNEQHCFVLGTDFSSRSPIKIEKEEEEQPLRHFFDVWPLENKDSWMDLEDNESNQAYFSNTQLSISIPVPSTDHQYKNP